MLVQINHIEDEDDLGQITQNGDKKESHITSNLK
jgi:hypothetical protein